MNPNTLRAVRKTLFLSMSCLVPFNPDFTLDKMMRADLDVWSSFWFWILIASTIMVATGIVCEAPEIWQAVGLGRKTVERIRKLWYIRLRKIDLNGWERPCPELITKKSHSRQWIAKIGFIGWVSVALGVAGEGIAEYFVSDAETNIRAFDESLLAEAQRKASQNEREAAQLRRDAEGLKKDAEDEHAARVEIEAKVAWRRLNDKEQSDMAAKVGMFPPNSEGVSLWTDAGDTEAATFAVDIAKSLKQTHAVVQPPGQIMEMRESGKFGDPIRPFPTGVSVLPTKDDVSQNFADRVVKQLNLRGFDAVRRKDPPSKDGKVPQIEIFVYQRPEGPQGEYKLQAEQEAEAKKKQAQTIRTDK